MEFFDKLTKKATETYKGAAEKTGKIAKEAKLKIKINENKAKINNIYSEIGKKIYQKHISEGTVCIKGEVEEECAKIDELSAEIESYNKEILELSNAKICVKCNEEIDRNAKFCPKCGAEQPVIEEEKAKEVEIVEESFVETEETENNTSSETNETETKEEVQSENIEQEENKEDNNQ